MNMLVRIEMIENELRSVKNFSNLSPVSSRTLKAYPGALFRNRGNSGNVLSDGGDFDRSPISFEEIPS